MRLTRLCLSGLLCIGAVAFAGCGKKPEAQKAQDNKPQAKQPAATQPLVPAVQAMDWCKEHGVPESVCTRCNKALVEDFKKKGDWCKEHDVPESQCFKCHPELKAKFAAAFKAKYGKEPPAME